MSKRAGPLVKKSSKQLQRLYGRGRRSSSRYAAASAASPENVLATVKASDEATATTDSHEENAGGEIASRLHNEKFLQQQTNGHKTKIVEDIEKWLKTSSEPIASIGVNMKGNSRSSVERYLDEPLSEIFFEKCSSGSDIDFATKKSNVGYDSIFSELHNEKFMLQNEKDDEFIMPELPLDIDPLTYCGDDMILTNEIVPSISSSPQYTNSNTDSKDLIIELEDTINRFNHNEKTYEYIETQNSFQELSENEQNIDDTNILNDYEKDICPDSLPAAIQDLPIENLSFTESDVENPDYCTNFENDDAYDHIIEPEEFSIQSYAEIRPKNSIVKYNNLSSQKVNLMKPKFQPSIIKRRRKVVNEGNTYCNDNENTSIISSSKYKQSNVKQVIINKNNDYRKSYSLRSSKKTRLKSESSDTNESEYEENIQVRRLPIYNQQELIITKALEEIGITDKMLRHGIVIGPDNTKEWQCQQDKCRRQFPKLCGLKTHILTHFGIKPFKCDYDGCLWAFYSEFKLKRHKETHLKKKDYVCSIPGCKRRFTTIYNLASHEKLHSRPNHIFCQVPECDSKFQTKRDLEIHMRNHDESFAPYVCTVDGCGKRYYGSSALMSHQRSHSHSQMDVTCAWPGCGKTFDQPCRLKAHMRFHTGSKPYACTFKGCKWAFSTSSKLKRHQKKHTNDRKFACDIGNCNKAFMRSDHLREHKLTHTEKRLFECHLCNSAFSAKSTLYVHIKKHKNNKDCVGRPKTKKTEKKTVNKKKEIFCSRVQPVKVTVNKIKQLLITDCLESEKTNDQDTSIEEDENVSDEIILSNSSTKNEASKNLYFCSADNCTKWYRTKISLKMHLQKEHVTPLSEIQNSNIAHEISTSPISPNDNNSYSKSQYSIKKPSDRLILPTNETSDLNYEATESATENDMILQIEKMPLSVLHDIHSSSIQVSSGEQFVKKNEGSARTAFTHDDILALKPNRRVADSSVGASDVVLGAADFEADLLLPEDLTSMYCQEDIGVPGYQILLLDTGPTDNEISMRDLD